MYDTRALAATSIIPAGAEVFHRCEGPEALDATTCVETKSACRRRGGPSVSSAVGSGASRTSGPSTRSWSHLGWGHMPLPVVAADLAAGRLVRIELEGPQPMIMTMHAIYRLDTRTRRPMADQRASGRGMTERQNDRR
jgi:hypothetical protein